MQKNKLVVCVWTAADSQIVFLFLMSRLYFFLAIIACHIHFFCMPIGKYHLKHKMAMIVLAAQRSVITLINFISVKSHDPINVAVAAHTRSPVAMDAQGGHAQGAPVPAVLAILTP